MAILSPDKVKLNVKVQDKLEAVRIVGQMLVDGGHVPKEYIDYMLERENKMSTYMGAGLAIPHGTNEAKQLIRSTGLAIMLVPEGVEFEAGQQAKIIVGIAAIGDDHMDLLTNIAMIVSDDETSKRLLEAIDEQEVIDIFQAGTTS